MAIVAVIVAVTAVAVEEDILPVHGAKALEIAMLVEVMDYGLVMPKSVIIVTVVECANIVEVQECCSIVSFTLGLNGSMGRSPAGMPDFLILWRLVKKCNFF